MKSLKMELEVSGPVQVERCTYWIASAYMPEQPPERRVWAAESAESPASATALLVEAMITALRPEIAPA